MKIAGIEIVGESVSGIGTSISLPELGITLDCGVITPASMKCQHVLITHGHLDHIHCIDRHAYLRAMTGSPDKSIFYVPSHLKAAVEAKFEAMARCQSRTDMPEFEIRVIDPGQTMEIRKGLAIRPFKTVHRVKSQGYVVLDVRQKLKAEFSHLSGQEIGALRKSGTEVTERVEFPLVAFTGDTEARVFDQPQAAEALKAKVLITECTFMGDFPLEKARKRGHVHMDELAERADLFQNEAVLMAHFSQRYTNAEVKEALAALPESLRAKTDFVRLPKHALML